MDGWWREGFNGKNGWTFGKDESGDNMGQADAEAIYRILEQEIISLYYKVSDDGTPRDWVKLIKESAKSNASSAW